MDTASIKSYFDLLSESIYDQNGPITGHFLSVNAQHSKNARIYMKHGAVTCAQQFEEGWCDLVAEHLRVLYELNQDNVSEAFTHQVIVVQIYSKILQSQNQSNWGLPILFKLIQDMRVLAFKVDSMPNTRRKEHECLEQSADVLMSCFRICANDTRTQLNNSKKWAMLNIVNNLLKIYFKALTCITYVSPITTKLASLVNINKMHLCKPMIRSIDGLAIKDYFQLSQRITYKYYLGRKAMYESDLGIAEEALQFAFDNCHKLSKNNKRKILIYLIPVKMLLGHMPKKFILDKYNLGTFANLALSVKTGNIRLFNSNLEENKDFYIFYGIFIIIEKLKILTYRNLFKRISLIMGTHQLQVSDFTKVLEWLEGEEICDDEVEMIVANLISNQKIKGYISHTHGKVIISKVNSFPRIPTA